MIKNILDMSWLWGDGEGQRSSAKYFQPMAMKLAKQVKLTKGWTSLIQLILNLLWIFGQRSCCIKGSVTWNRFSQIIPTVCPGAPIKRQQNPAPVLSYRTDNHFLTLTLALKRKETLLIFLPSSCPFPVCLKKKPLLSNSENYINKNGKTWIIGH